MSDVTEALAAVNSAEAAATPAPVETPSTPTTEAPAPTAEATPAEATPEMHELPDGRKVDGKTLAKEWKENFMPDYTKKSQELAKLSKPEVPQPQTEQPKWKDPEWQPQTYQELMDAAEERVLTRLENDKLEALQKTEQVNSWVQSQIDEIKKTEPNLSEDLLFQHANKYQFSDLKTAHQNMRDMNLAVKHTEQKVLKNLKTREAEPIAAKPNAGDVSDGIDYNFDRRESAAEVLARIKG